MGKKSKKISIFTFMLLLVSPMALFAAGKSSIDYEAKGVYAGIRTIGTLPSTSKTIVHNEMDKGNSVEVTPQQKNGFGNWTNASSMKVMGTQTSSFSLNHNKPTKLWFHAHGGQSADIHGYFTD